MNSDVIRKMVCWVFVIRNDICSGKLRSIHNPQPGVDILIYNYGYPLGIEEDAREIAVGIVSLFNGVRDLALG